MNNSTFSDLRKAKSETCIPINRKFVITNAYEGIPETLLLNVIGFVVLLGLFTVLRRKAWDYGRLALVNNTRRGRHWTQFFYAQSQEDQLQQQQNNQILSNSNSNSNGGYNFMNQLSTSTSSTTISVSSPPPPPINQSDTSNPSTPHSLLSASDNGLLSWIWITLKLKKEQFLMHSGPDAVHYLSFQQHLLIVMAIITFISLVLILPINFQGELLGNKTSFGHTTLPNLDPKTPWLWIHVIIAIAYAPLIVLIMRRSSGRYAFKIAPTRSIMITNISTRDRNKTTIRNYIQQLFPDVTIEDVQLAYNVTKLMSKHEEYERAVEARLYCENHLDKLSLKVRPNFCSCERIPAYEFYQMEEQRLEGEVARLRASALNEPLGIAFVTVANVKEAQNIVTHFRPGSYRQWNLKFAPLPSDIYWENLSVSTSRWYVKWVIVNIALFFVLFFLTTPAIILAMLDSWKISSATQDTINKISPIISESIPTLMLWTLSAVLPVIVAYSEKWLSHWTRSLQNYSTMTKTFGYLLFMILILPSLGLSSVEAMIEWTFSKNNTSRWECFFLPDKGAFFVNYVITAAFIGISLELIRFPDLIVYMWHMCIARSRAETPYIRKYIYSEFDFGVQYAWTLLVFTMTTVYSIPCPLIAPFGMLHLLMKHFVDRYNLYFTYKGTNMISQNGGKIHSTAVTMTKFSTIILLTVLSGFTVIREGVDARSCILISSLLLILILFTFMSPIKRCTTKRPSITETTSPTPLYYPDILRGRINTLTPPLNVSEDSSLVIGGGGSNNYLHRLRHPKRSYGTDETFKQSQLQPMEQQSPIVEEQQEHENEQEQGEQREQRESDRNSGNVDIDIIEI